MPCGRLHYASRLNSGVRHRTSIVGLVVKLLAVINFACGLYGAALYVIWITPSFAGLRKLTPRAWRRGKITPTRQFVTVRAGFLATFGSLVGFQVLHLYLLTVIFAVPTIIFSVMLIEQSLREAKPQSDA